MLGPWILQWIVVCHNALYLPVQGPEGYNWLLCFPWFADAVVANEEEKKSGHPTTECFWNKIKVSSAGIVMRWLLPFRYCWMHGNSMSMARNCTNWNMVLSTWYGRPWASESLFLDSVRRQRKTVENEVEQKGYGWLYTLCCWCWTPLWRQGKKSSSSLDGGWGMKKTNLSHLAGMGSQLSFRHLQRCVLWMGRGWEPVSSTHCRSNPWSIFPTLAFHLTHHYPHLW